VPFFLSSKQKVSKKRKKHHDKVKAEIEGLLGLHCPLINQMIGWLMGEFVRRTMSTIWHYRGGCLVGKVVDRNFRVIGIDALRVVYGSIVTVSPETNQQATLLMLGRKRFAPFSISECNAHW